MNIEAGLTFFADVPDPNPPFQPLPNPLGQFHLVDMYGTSALLLPRSQPSREEHVQFLEEGLPDPLIWRVATRYGGGCWAEASRYPRRLQTAIRS